VIVEVEEMQSKMPKVAVPVLLRGDDGWLCKGNFGVTEEAQMSRVMLQKPPRDRSAYGGRNLEAWLDPDRGWGCN
jgi:hypothetical protein